MQSKVAMELFDYLKRLLAECLTHSKHIVFDKKCERHLYLVALYGSLIELTGSLIILIDNKHGTGVNPIFRSIFEAYVEFFNLDSDPEYVRYMKASYHEQWLKVEKEARKGSNPFLKSISESPDLEASIQECEVELDGLKEKGYRPLKIWERLKKAEMVDEYRSLYNFLSNDVHSNIRALLDRHLEIHENDFTVVYHKDRPLDDFLPPLQSTAEFLVDASLKIHQFFETKTYSAIEGLSKELDEIKSRL